MFKLNLNHVFSTDAFGTAFNAVKNATADVGYLFSNGAFGHKGHFSQLVDSLTGKEAADQYREQTELAKKQYAEQFDYQKMLNQLQMEREDTAYQRAAKDMYAAGLNPVNGINPANASSMQGVSPNFNGGATSSSSSASLGDILSFVLGLGEVAVTERIAQGRLAEDTRHNQEMEKSSSSRATSYGEQVKNQGKVNDARAQSINNEEAYWSSVGSRPTSATHIKEVTEGKNIVDDAIDTAREAVGNYQRDQVLSDALLDVESLAGKSAYEYYLDTNGINRKNPEAVALARANWMTDASLRTKTYYDLLHSQVEKNKKSRRGKK